MIDEELARMLKEGPTAKELERVKVEQLSGFIRGAERIGGFGGKSDILAMSQVYTGNPEYYKTMLQEMREATPEQIRDTAREWLGDGDYNLEVHPFPEYATSGSDVDRSKLPELGEVPDTKFPELQRGELKNGMKVILAERHTIPVVNFNLIVDAGYASDQEVAAGTAKLAMNMLDEGTKSRSALEISDELQLLGASLGAGSDLDTSSVFLSALKANLDKSLDLFADVILNPAFPEEELDRLKKNQVDAIQREKVQPFTMALRVFPKLLYGAGHAYANPFTGSGSERSVQEIGRGDIVKFYETWFKAGSATIVVAGDTTMAEIKPKLEKLFDKMPKGSAPKKNIAAVERGQGSVVYLMDRPGSIQSIVFAGNLTVPKDNPHEVAIQSMNKILGGEFTARLNMNLREDKHWSYGAQTMIVGARGQRPFMAYAPVQTDKTKESMVEIAKEFKAILSDRPATPEELAKTKRQQVLELAGTWETIGAVGGSIGEIVRFGLPDDYFDTYAERIKGLELPRIAQAAGTVIHQDGLVWVVVGDLAKIEQGVRELGFGEVRFIDADGNPVERRAAGAAR
jgi:zinc protease